MNLLLLFSISFSISTSTHFLFFLYCLFGSPNQFFYSPPENLYISKPNPQRRSSDKNRIVFLFCFLFVFRFFFFGRPSYFTHFPFILLNSHCMKYQWNTETITTMEPTEKKIFVSLFSGNQETIAWFSAWPTDAPAKISVSQSEKWLKFLCGSVWCKVPWQYPTMAVVADNSTGTGCALSGQFLLPILWIHLVSDPFLSLLFLPSLIH